MLHFPAGDQPFPSWLLNGYDTVIMASVHTTGDLVAVLVASATSIQAGLGVKRGVGSNEKFKQAPWPTACPGAGQ
jgi:hypothetical protein